MKKEEKQSEKNIREKERKKAECNEKRKNPARVHKCVHK
jgi:hypothetical protein